MKPKPLNFNYKKKHWFVCYYLLDFAKYLPNNRLNPAIFACKPQYFPPFSAKRGLIDKFIQKK